MSISSENWDNQILGKDFFKLVTENPAFLEILPCAAYLIKDDSDYTVLQGNSRFYTLLDCSEEHMQQLYSNSLAAFFTANSIEEFHTLAHQKKDTFIRLRQHMKRYGRDAWIDTQAIRLKLGDAWVFCCVSYDVTAQQQNLVFYREYKDVAELAAGQINFDVFQYDLNSQEAYIYKAHCFLPPELTAASRKKVSMKEKNFPERLVYKEYVHPEYEKVFRNAFDSLHQGETKVVCELRMKSVRKEKYAWARLSLAVNQKAKPPGQYAVGVLEDITQQKEMSLQYLNETQFYQAMLSEKAAFAQVDVTEDRCTRFGGMWNLYNEIIDTLTYSEIIYQFINKVVHPEDRQHYLDLMQRSNFIQSLDNGIDQLGCEFRRIVAQNKMMWMELKVHLFREPFTQHVLALVYLNNIDARKKQELALLHDSERDHLTNIYNKKMAESSISKYLTHMGRNEICAFMILDLDDFKLINDTYGHKVGDQVLVRLAEILGNVFHRNDIIGRFGGDEFIIFLKNISSKQEVQAQLEKLYEYLRNEKEPEIFCSIGLTLVFSTVSYGQAFHEADVALYAAKSEGKGRFVFFKKEELKEGLAPMVSRRSETSIESMILEHPAAEEVSFESFLAEQGEMAYLVDPETFGLICGNKAFYDRIGVTESECLGFKCYEAMQKRQSPCPFCSKANWSTDKFYLWKNLNVALEQEFLIKNKLVQWRGKEVMLAIAIDISNNKSIVDSIDNGAMESHSILSGVQNMAGAVTLAEAMSSALETIGYFFRADAVRFWEQEPLKGAYRCISSWSKSRKDGCSGKTEVNAWLRGQKWGQSLQIESPEAMLCHSYEMYQFMKDHNIVNQRWIQLRDGAHELGYISVDNISSNFQNVAFLESFGVFIAVEIKKRRLMEGILYSNEHDNLTDLLSRNSYEKYMQNYNCSQVRSIGAMMADFDNLTGINSAKGFLTGNHLLKLFADMLKAVFPDSPVFRLNGDEFLVITSDLKLLELEERIQRLRDKVRKQGEFTVSIGYSWDDEEKSLTPLIRQATHKMKAEKQSHYDTASKSGKSGRTMSRLHKQEESQ